MVIVQKDKKQQVKQQISYLVSMLGAVGIALQNYIAVELFIKGMLSGVVPMSKLLTNVVKAIALGAGGACSGMVNFFINVKLLNKFIDRMEGEPKYKSLQGWTKFRYFAGIGVFIVTGALFGMTAFTFGMASPLAILAIASGVFVSMIMTVQEVETWLESFDNDGHKSLSEIFRDWKKSLTIGKMCGHIIALGNVIALSLLFALGMAEVLVALNVAAFTAFAIGMGVAFTFGAFTEFYFYNYFLSDFCGNFATKWQDMMASSHAKFGVFCVSLNAFVNTALTYSGVAMLAGVCVSAGVALPSMAVLVTLSAVSAFFAGTASFVLGMDFWISNKSTTTAEQSGKTEQVLAEVPTTPVEPVIARPGLAFFPKVDTTQPPKQNAPNCVVEQKLVVNF